MAVEKMTSEVPDTAGAQLENGLTRNGSDIDSRIRNLSIQTGEEFSPEFIRDRTPRRKANTGEDCPQKVSKERRSPRNLLEVLEDCPLEYPQNHGASTRSSTENLTDQHQQRRIGFHFNPNQQLVYDDRAGCGISKGDPENRTGSSGFWSGNGIPVQAEKHAYSDSSSRCHYKDYTPREYQQHQQPLTDTDETYNHQLGFYSTSPQYKSGSPRSYQHYGHVSGIPDGSFCGKMKFLCSFSGKILPRPSDGKLRYVGGETRIISIRKTLSYQELMKKTSAICNQPHTIKYQLPGEDLDALISVCSGEDLQHMIEEYHELERGSQRLRIFLIPLNDPESPCSDDSRSIHQTDKSYQYVVAVNGMNEPCLRKNSSKENLLGRTVESSPSSQRYTPNSAQPMDAGGSSLNLNMKLINPTQMIQSPVNMMSSYMQAPAPHMPVQLKDPLNPQLIVYRDRVDPPAYDNPYHLDATSYHANHPLNSVTAGNVSSFRHPHGQGDMDVQRPVHNESAIQSKQFEAIKENTRTSGSDNLPTIATSDLDKQYAEWSQDNITWMAKNNSNLNSGRDPDQNQYIVSSATTSGEHHYIVRTPSSNAIFNLSSGLHYDSSQEMGRADVYSENHVLVTASTESDCILSSNLNENGPLINDLVIISPAIPTAIRGDVSRVKSSVDNVSDRSPSQISDDKNDADMPEFPLLVDGITDHLPPDIPSSEAVMPYTEDEPSDGVLTPSDKQNEGVAQSDSKDVEDDKGVKGEHISGSRIAQMEAGMYGLQIIRNSDLEELRELGSGTFGTVYHGKWRGTDVAIKRIKKSCFSGKKSEQERLTKDFWREAQILSRLHHPNVVALYGVVPDGPGGTLSTVTEYMANGSLRHVLLRKDRSLDRRKRLIIMQDAAIGMEYLHLKNIVHFDLKCENLLVNLGDPQRPVGDFGLSRIKRNTFVSGGVRGTLPWMAPELLSGSSTRVSEKVRPKFRASNSGEFPMTETVDVFSFGISMWEILTGEEPYADMHCGAIIGGIMSNTLRPPIPERCDRRLKALMEECWSYDPAARPSFTEITNKFQVMSKKQNQAKR
ncbi:Phox/Bem1p [Cynara cardunculus var. scolymus]|uniref:Phox/Bem1p n=1 Tax=Cynara cardunculus var. scolymus TaxID=59895 RepID=A0A103Y0J0_CYNCS|nr:Phox/Bem1p [Cynara cardunculus var. scolymus]